MASPLLNTIDDPAEDRLLRAALAEQAEDPSDPLARDMARDVLAGNVTLYQAAGSNVYGEVFAQRTDAFVRWWHETPEDERERLSAAGQEALDEARRDDSQARGYGR